MVTDTFQVYGVKTIGKYIGESKIKSVHFYSFPHAKLSLKLLSLPLKAEQNYSFLPNSVFKSSIFSSARSSMK